jgi:hypothetical protein
LVAVLQPFEGAVDKADLARIAPADQLPRLLYEIADDPEAPALARNRAIGLLGDYPSPDGVRLLQHFADAGATSLVRKTARAALARARPSP